MATWAAEEFLKTPTEASIFPWEVPADHLATGETITTATVSSTPTGGSHVVWGAAAINGRFVESKATGGVIDQDYEVKLNIVTSLGQNKDYCAKLKVRAC
jgi:hypothetical protein